MDMDCNFCLFEFGSISLKFYYRLNAGELIQLRGAPIKKFKVPWRVGPEVARYGYFLQSSIDQAVKALETILGAFQQQPDPRKIVAFATGVFRDAENNVEFTQTIWDKIGLSVYILSEEQEAALLQSAYMGGKQPTAPVFVFDLGGGSCQWVNVQADGDTQRGSLPIGVFRFHDFFDGGLRHVDLPLTKRVIDRAFVNLPSVMATRLIGTGGTVKALSRVLRRNVLTRRTLEKLEEQVWINGPPASLKPHRRPLFLPGLVLVEHLMDRIGASELHYRDLSIGKGLLLKVLPYCSTSTRYPRGRSCKQLHRQPPPPRHLRPKRIRTRMRPRAPSVRRR